MRQYLALAALTLIAFGGSLGGSFHFDDYAMLASPQGPAWWLQTRPLTQFTFWLNYLLGGTNPAGFHLVNLLLHFVVVCLLFQLLQEVVSEKIAFTAAILFAIHPIQSEAVAYVFARGSLLATLFCLLCWRAWRQGQMALALIWFAAALLSKEECVTFPFVLMLLGPRRWKLLIGMLALSVAVGLHTVYATKVIADSGAGFTAGVSPFEYLAAQGLAIVRYFRLLAVPWGFTIDPDLHPNFWKELAAWSIVIAALVYWRANRWFIAGIILLIPSSSILPAADLAADRRMYLPLIAFSVAFAPMVRKWMYPAAVLLIVLSIMRMEVWRTEPSLWREAVERSPDKPRPRIQLARAVAPQDALQVLSGAPLNADLLTERGRVYLDLQQPAEALREFGKALAIKPRDAHAVNNRGVALLALGQTAAARVDFEKALKIDPGLRDAQVNLARAMAAAK